MTEKKTEQINVTHIQMGNIEFILETIYGNHPLEEIFADYVADRIKEERLENVA